LRVYSGGSSASLLTLPPFLDCYLFFNHKTIQLCQKIKKAKETRAVAVVTAVVAVQKEGLHRRIRKPEKEYQEKVVRLPVAVVVKEKGVAREATKDVNRFP
jgi:hypothetical protein